MATLGKIAQGDRRTVSIAWRVDGNPLDLFGASFTGWKRDHAGIEYAIDGSLAVSDGPTGVMAWTMGEADTGAPGVFSVQFRAVIGGVAYRTLPARWEVVRSLGLAAIEPSELEVVGVPEADAAFLSSLADAGALGSAAYEAAGAFDAAGSAAAVQGNLDTHTGATGAGVHGAGATGAALLATATQDAARGELGFAPVAMPPIETNLTAIAYIATDVLGSGIGAGVGLHFLSQMTGTTANSRHRWRQNVSRLSIGYASYRMDFDRPHRFVIAWRVASLTADGEWRVFVNKVFGDDFGETDNGKWIGIRCGAGGQPTHGIYRADASGIKAVSITAPAYGLNENHIIIEIDGSGGIKWIHNNLLLATVADGPTGQDSGCMSFEVENKATAENLSITNILARSYSFWQ
jgi:hypothetical protein